MMKGKQSKRRRKRKVIKKEDRISSLPDCLLVDIITRLDSTEEAIRTGTLSKRWEHLWREVPNLIFIYDDVDDVDCIFDFYDSVENILSEYGQSNINKFQLHASYTYEKDVETCSVDTCIRYAIDLNVREFDINIWDYRECTGFVLPKFFFNCSSFIHLKISGGARKISVGGPKQNFFRKYIKWEGRNKFFSENTHEIANKYTNGLRPKGAGTLPGPHIAPPLLKMFECYFDKVDVIRWKNLRSLSIGFGRLHEDLFQKILSGSPLLETLVLENCYGFERLDITNMSVKNLVIAGDPDGHEDFVKINAPYILSLTIKDHFPLMKLLLENVSSVIKAELDYTNKTYEEMNEDQEMNEELLKGFILSLSHVKELKIGKLCLKVFACLKAKGFKCPSNLKVLEVIDSN